MFVFRISDLGDGSYLFLQWSVHDVNQQLYFPAAYLGNRVCYRRADPAGFPVRITAADRLHRESLIYLAK